MATILKVGHKTTKQEKKMKHEIKNFLRWVCFHLLSSQNPGNQKMFTSKAAARRAVAVAAAIVRKGQSHLEWAAITHTSDLEYENPLEDGDIRGAILPFGTGRVMANDGGGAIGYAVDDLTGPLADAIEGVKSENLQMEIIWGNFNSNILDAVSLLAAGGSGPSLEDTVQAALGNFYIPSGEAREPWRESHHKWWKIRIEDRNGGRRDLFAATSDLGEYAVDPQAIRPVWDIEDVYPTGYDLVSESFASAYPGKMREESRRITPEGVRRLLAHDLDTEFLSPCHMVDGGELF